ncbi:MAG: hypothetical protein QHJ73_06850, partial [Armatimonadota bacterium]|nr:hypothetical protein [Armatimonadota bacterium]
MSPEALPTPAKRGSSSLPAGRPCRGHTARTGWVLLTFLAVLAVTGNRGAAQPRKSEPRAGAVELLLQDFERALSLTAEPSPNRVHVNLWLAEENAAQGFRSAGIAWIGHTDGVGFFLRCDLSLPGEPEALHFWVRGDTGSARLTALFADAAGITHELPLDPVHSTEWEERSLSLGSDHSF